MFVVEAISCQGQMVFVTAAACLNRGVLSHIFDSMSKTGDICLIAAVCQGQNVVVTYSGCEDRGYVSYVAAVGQG